jgi:hypothetical protein
MKMPGILMLSLLVAAALLPVAGCRDKQAQP